MNEIYHEHACRVKFKNSGEKNIIINEQRTRVKTCEAKPGKRKMILCVCV